MEWVGLAFAVTLVLAAIVLLIIGIKGGRSAKTDGWSPIEAALGQKFRRKDRPPRDAE